MELLQQAGAKLCATLPMRAQIAVPEGVVAGFHANGYAKVEGVLTPEEITALQVGLGRNVALYYLPFIGFFLSGSITDLLGYSMPQFLKRPCD